MKIWSAPFWKTRAYAARPISRKGSLHFWRNANPFGARTWNNPRRRAPRFTGHENDRIPRRDSTGALRRDRPDGRGLPRELFGVVRGWPRGIDPRAGYRV